MKAALIPPIAHLEDFCGDQEFHLVLSHLLERPAYLKFYREQHLRGRYIVLDNGAHENKEGEGVWDLLQKARLIRPAEMVLPDTLFDHRATVRGAEDSLKILVTQAADYWDGQAHPKIMLVPQGKTRREWEACFHDLIGAYVKAQMAMPALLPTQPVIGVSKDYEVLDGGVPSLLDFLAGFKEWMQFDVHLLGWGRNLGTLYGMAERFPWVRSTDSAKPFVYALYQLVLDPDGRVPVYPGRPARFFDAVFDKKQMQIARRNVAAFKETAHDD